MLQSAFLGDRLHLQHGPIDLICRAWGHPGQVRAAYQAGAAAFAPLLADLCSELTLLRTPLPAPLPLGRVARAMHHACTPFATAAITPMAAVAGAVADHVLAAMREAGALHRAFVNNGGDISFHLGAGRTLRCGLVADLAAPALDGVFELRADHPARGLATSGRACKGRGGRSFSFGIADAVTVLAATAAQADAAATMVANAVDLPGHPAILRRPACAIDPDSDLGARAITWEVGALSRSETAAALDAGALAADALLVSGLIHGAVLTLRHAVRVCGIPLRLLEPS